MTMTHMYPGDLCRHTHHAPPSQNLGDTKTELALARSEIRYVEEKLAAAKEEAATKVWRGCAYGCVARQCCVKCALVGAHACRGDFAKIRPLPSWKFYCVRDVFITSPPHPPFPPYQEREANLLRQRNTEMSAHIKIYDDKIAHAAAEVADAKKQLQELGMGFFPSGM